MFSSLAVGRSLLMDARAIGRSILLPQTATIKTVLASEEGNGHGGRVASHTGMLWLCVMLSIFVTQDSSLFRRNLAGTHHDRTMIQSTAPFFSDVGCGPVKITHCVHMFRGKECLHCHRRT